MGGKKPAAMFPKPRPDFFEIGFGHLESAEGIAGKKLESAFAMVFRDLVQFPGDFKEEEQPMALPLKATLADDACQVQRARRNCQAKFFLSFSASASIR